MPSSPQIDMALTDRALQALLKHHDKNTAAAETTSLLGNDVSVQVQFGLDKVPENPSIKPIRIGIPHALYKLNDDSQDSLEEPSVCLIVKDDSKPWVQELIGEFPLGFVKKVLGLQSLRKKHARYEQRRLLLSRFDVFMADDRILPMLHKALGKDFIKAKKQPIPLNLTRKQALPFVILQSLQSTFLYLSSGTTLTVRAGTTGMAPNKVLANIEAVFQHAVQKIPGKWSNIRTLSLKLPTSASLPFYNKTPHELQQLAEMAGVVKVVEEEKDETIEMKRQERRKRAAKSPLVKALKQMEKEASQQEASVEEEAVEITIREKRSTNEEGKNKKKKKSKRKMAEEANTVEEDSNVTPQSTSKETKKRKLSSFIKSKRYKGTKEGYVFRSGSEGVGYYVDVKPVVDKMAMEALHRLASTGRSKMSKKGKRSRR